MVRKVFVSDVATHGKTVSYSTEDERISSPSNHNYYNVSSGSEGEYEHHQKVVHHDQYETNSMKPSEIVTSRDNDDGKSNFADAMFFNSYDMASDSNHSNHSNNGLHNPDPNEILPYPYHYYGSFNESEKYPGNLVDLKRSDRVHGIVCTDMWHQRQDSSKRIKQFSLEIESHYPCLLADQLQIVIPYLIQDGRVVCKSVSVKIKHAKFLCREAINLRRENKRIKEFIIVTFLMLKKARSYMDDLVELVSDFKCVRSKMRATCMSSEFLLELTRISVEIVKTIHILEESDRTINKYSHKLSKICATSSKGIHAKSVEVYRNPVTQHQSTHVHGMKYSAECV